MMEWIKIKDRIPEERVIVLTFEHIKTLTVDHIKSDKYQCRLDYIILMETEELGYIWACRQEDEMNRATHWMPLPPPPYEDEIHRPISEIFKK